MKVKKKKVLPPWKKSYDQPRQHIKKQRHYFADKGPRSQSYGFSSSHVRMWELDHKESWALKSWCFGTVMLKKTLEHPLDCKEIQPVHPKGNQSWTFIGKTDAEAEAPILWPPHRKNWLNGKEPDAGKDWRQEKGRQRMRWLMASLSQWCWPLTSAIHPEQPLGHVDRQGSLVCCSPWGRKIWTQLSNWTELKKKRKISVLYNLGFFFNLKELFRI